MKAVRCKSLILFIVAACFVGTGLLPAMGAAVISQSANTDIYLGEPFAGLEFENPLVGVDSF